MYFITIWQVPHGMQADIVAVHDRCTHSSVLTIFLHKQTVLNQCRAFQNFTDVEHLDN